MSSKCTSPSKKSTHLEMDNEPTDEDLTPTNAELKSMNEIPLKPYRFCVSPVESDHSSGRTTPDATLLNKEPFAVKLVPELLKSPATPPGSPEADSSSSADPFTTPEKPNRPIGFKNLSPRSVTYEFSATYPSGVIRPVKVRRSFQSLFDLNPDTEVSSRLTRRRAVSEDFSVLPGAHAYCNERFLETSELHETYPALSDNNVEGMDSEKQTNQDDDSTVEVLTRTIN